MNRKQTISKLIKEGFSEKTLASLNDKQLSVLSKRILGEQYMNDESPVTHVSKTDAATQSKLKQEKKPFTTYEGEMKEGGEENVERDDIIKKIHFKIKHTDDESKIENLKELLRRMGEKVDEPELASVGLNEWVDEVVGNSVHPFTSKSEILSLIQEKLNEQEIAEPEVETETLPEWLTYNAIKAAEPAPAEPTTKPTTRPGKPDQKPRPRTPYQPGPGINPRPKAEKE
jgi:hypothetical protein